MNPGEKPAHIKLTNRVSPFTLRIIADSSEKYRKAYKSYAFGITAKLAGKWVWFAVAAIVIVIVLMFASGNIPGVG